MRTLKHIGKIKNTGVKVLVIFRTLPGESNMCLVLPVATLPDQYHDSIMTLVETDQAQETFEFGEIMHVRPFPDGRPMLKAMQQDNRLQKVATDSVIMTPTPNTGVTLSDLNVMIAEQKNCSIDDLYTFVKGAPSKKTDQSEKQTTVANSNLQESTSAPLRAQASENSVLTDKDLAKSYRSQADSLYKEAARLRKEADTLDPIVKKTKKAEDTVDA
jgi:hypothetical protein